MSEVYLGLGSNQNNPEQQVLSAINQLKAHPAMQVVQTSSLYQSRAWGLSDQPDFINACVRLDTELTPQELLFELQLIEKNHKRKRTVKWGPRTLDLDILLFGSLRLNSPQLTIPHLYLMERDFVVYPLAEIAPALVLPNGRTIKEVMTTCPRGELEQLS